MRLFREACRKHIELMKEAVDGQGMFRSVTWIFLRENSTGTVFYFPYENPATQPTLHHLLCSVQN